MAQSKVTSLDWMPETDDRFFVYGTKYVIIKTNQTIMLLNYSNFRSGVIKLMDVTERRVSTEFDLGQSIQSISCSSNSNLLSASVAPDSLVIYDLKSSTKNNLVTNSNSELTSCLFNHNSQMVFASGTDGKVRIFDLRKHDCIASWSVHPSEPIITLTLSQDETSIFALTSGGHFSSWSIYQTGQNVFEHKLEDPFFDPKSSQSCWSRQMAFAANGKHFLSCSSNGGVIYEFDSDNVDKLLGLKGHQERTTCTDWTSVGDDCGPCVTADVTGQIRISTLLSQ